MYRRATHAASRVNAVVLAIVIAQVVVVPLVFWRGVAAPFDLVKASALWLSGLFLAAALITVALTQRRPSWEQGRALMPVGALAVAAIVVTLTSFDPHLSWFGQPGRFTGAATLVSCAITAGAIVVNGDRGTAVRIAQALIVTIGVVAVYSFVQAWNLDPFAWDQSSFAQGSFSTVGNPNTAAGYTSTVLPLAAWMMLRHETSRAGRVCGGAALGAGAAALGTFESFQGPVAALATATFVCLWAWRVEKGMVGRSVLVGLAMLVMLSAFVALPGALLVLPAVCGAVCGATASWWRVAPSQGPTEAARVPWRLWPTVVVAALIVAVLVLAGPVIVAELQDGLRLRRYHYETGIALFREAPLLGHGLDTYAYESMRVMNPDFVTLAREKLSSSVHSIPLGMFVSGGLLLGLAYAALCGVSLWIGVRHVRRCGLSCGSSGFVAALVAAQVAFHVQSIVTVENVALFLVLFTLVGLMVVAVRREPPQQPRASRTEVRPPALLLAVPTIAAVLLAATMSRPLRSAQAAERASSQAPNLTEALSHLDRAVNLAPWDGYVRAERAFLLDAAGSSADAVEDAVRAAAQIHYYSLVTPDLAKLMVENGAFGEAIRVMEQVVEGNPTSARTSTLASELYATIGLRLFEAGRLDRAGDALRLALERDPSNAEAAALLGRLTRPS